MLWGEIKVDSDDLKHMVHRNGGFIELYNNIMTCLGDLGLLLAVPPLGSEWFGPEVGSKTQNRFVTGVSPSYNAHFQWVCNANLPPTRAQLMGGEGKSESGRPIRTP